MEKKTVVSLSCLCVTLRGSGRGSCPVKLINIVLFFFIFVGKQGSIFRIFSLARADTTTMSHLSVFTCFWTSWKSSNALVSISLIHLMEWAESPTCNGTWNVHSWNGKCLNNFATFLMMMYFTETYVNVISYSHVSLFYCGFSG